MCEALKLDLLSWNSNSAILSAHPGLKLLTVKSGVMIPML